MAFGVRLDALTLTLGDLEFNSVEFLQISLSIGLVVFVSRHEEILSEDARGVALGEDRRVDDPLRTDQPAAAGLVADALDDASIVSRAIHVDLTAAEARDEAAVVVYTHPEFECGDLFIVGTDLNILLADDVGFIASILAEMQKFSRQAVSRHADER